MKILVRFFCLLALPLTGLSQSMQFVSSRTLDTNVSSPRPLTLAERHVLPLFGEQRKTSEQIEEEIRFLSDCDKMFASRQEASTFFATRAWEYVQEGQLDTATYRFNLAYLLNEKNVEAFWGLGVICYQKDKLHDAERMMRRGVEIAPENVPLLVDLSSIELKHFAQTQEKEDLVESHQLLERAVALDSTYAPAFYNLALVNYHLADYPKAWEALHAGRKINLTLVDFQFVELLRGKLADPQGFFN